MTAAPSSIPTPETHAPRCPSGYSQVQKSSRRGSRLHIQLNGSPSICKSRTSSLLDSKSEHSSVSAPGDHSKQAPSTLQKTKKTGSPNPSPFISNHLGEPCSVGAMDHILACGHKVITTMQPEDCARNCTGDLPHRNYMTTNIRRLDESFVCIACIAQQIATNHGKKAFAFREELEMVARETRRYRPVEWIRDKIAIIEVAWQDQALEEMATRLQKGRMAQPFYIDPDFQFLVDEALSRMAERRPDEKIGAHLSTAVSTSVPKSKQSPEVAVRSNDQLHPPPSTAPSSSPAASRSNMRPASKLPVRRK